MAIAQSVSPEWFVDTVPGIVEWIKNALKHDISDVLNVSFRSESSYHVLYPNAATKTTFCPSGSYDVEVYFTDGSHVNKRFLPMDLYRSYPEAVYEWLNELGLYIDDLTHASVNMIDLGVNADGYQQYRAGNIFTLKAKDHIAYFVSVDGKWSRVRE